MLRNKFLLITIHILAQASGKPRDTLSFSKLFLLQRIWARIALLLLRRRELSKLSDIKLLHVIKWSPYSKGAARCQLETSHTNQLKRTRHLQHTVQIIKEKFLAYQKSPRPGCSCNPTAVHTLPTKVKPCYVETWRRELSESLHRQKKVDFAAFLFASLRIHL